MRALPLAVITSLSISTSGAAPAPASSQRAGDRYQSVRVLNDAPASQMIEMMSTIAGSLGVTCAHCHEADFASDAKPMTRKAREMILITRNVDTSFGGKGLITCNTCHQGKAIPPSFAPVEQAAWMRTGSVAEADVPLPTAAQVFDRYVDAVGGMQQLRRVVPQVEPRRSECRRQNEQRTAS